MYFGPRIFKNLGFDANLFQTCLGPGGLLRPDELMEVVTGIYSSG